MIDGGVLILGGVDADDQPIGSILRFDPASSAFSPFASMATPRASFAVGRLVDSRLLLVGGIHALAGGGTDATEVVGVDGGRRGWAGDDEGRFLHTVTALQSGKLLIVGGLDEARSAVASAEVFE